MDLLSIRAPHKVHNPLQVDERFLSPYPADAGGVCASTPETCAARGYIGKHVKKGDGPPDLMEGCGCSLTCYCNRRILKGMISVVDEMMANLTTSLERRGMWDSTVVILIGDNGAPVSTAGSNSIFKGHKFSHWEGGHRVPSFISGPAVSESLAGKVYKGTVHLVDLHRTILDLAGVAAPAQPSGVKPHDGVSMVGVLEGRAALDTPVRSELWIAHSVLRVGAYKVSQASAICSALLLVSCSSADSVARWQLITGAGSGPLTGMLGIGGRPAPTANDPTNLSSTAGHSSCTGDETGVDAETCRQCKCPGFAPGPDCHPCLYNVEEDPGVRALGSHAAWSARAVPAS